MKQILNVASRAIDTANTVADRGAAVTEPLTKIVGAASSVVLYVKAAIILVVTLFAVAVALLGYSVFNSAKAAEFSEGYRMGVVTKISEKGLITKSWEGQLLMGREGSPYAVTKGDKKMTVNPWYFSATGQIAPKINQLAGEYVWIRYTEDQIATSVTKDTPYNAVDIQPVTRAAPKDCDTTKNGDDKSTGVRVGRFVKASNKGTFVKTNEVLFQMGNAGNQFKAMSVEDETVYRCAVEFLKSGKQVKVFYTQALVNISFDDTAYNIYRIEAVKDL